MRRSAASLVSIVMLVSACTADGGEATPPTSPVTGDPPTSSSDPDPSDPDGRSCVRFTGDHSSPVDTGSLAGDALYLSGEVFVCADDVVVVGESDLAAVASAAQLAAALSGPLLFPDSRLAAELGRLKPERVHLIGGVEAATPSGAERLAYDPAEAAEAAREALAIDEVTSKPALDTAAIVETVDSIAEGGTVVSILPPASSTTASAPEVDEAELIRGLADPGDTAAVWLVDSGAPAAILMAAAMGQAIDARVIAVDVDDVLGHPEVGEALTEREPNTVRLVGAIAEAGQWELTVLANGRQLPGGGFYVLPREGKRRFLAFYGHPETPALGVLGEQRPTETRARMEEFVQAYAGDGSQVIPTFEMIASVAAAGAGEDGDYSFEWPVETFTPWVEFAAENGMYVVLDLQSGREHLLSQAMLYEDLLLQPHVGLALDPEWRLGPDEVHLRQTGSVDSSEVNEVVNWVADLVRDNGLPQKLMIVHQFRTDMITNRSEIIQRPEIQMVVQMDGDGTEAEKDATWSRLLEGAQDAHWAWGWKNFFDEDEPGPPSPESTMSKVPTPVYVSYQ